MDGLAFNEDIRHTEPNETGYRRSEFKKGWRNAASGRVYREVTLEQLTWHNLGYRSGKLFPQASEEMIDQQYAWCVDQQNEAKSQP